MNERRSESVAKNTDLIVKGAMHSTYYTIKSVAPMKNGSRSYFPDLGAKINVVIPSSK